MGEKNWEEKEKDKNRIILAIVQYTSRWYSSYRIYISLDITLTIIFDHLSPCKSWKYITLEYLDIYISHIARYFNAPFAFWLLEN